MLGDYIHNRFDKNTKQKGKRVNKKVASEEVKPKIDFTKIVDAINDPLPEIDSGSPHTGFKHKFQEFIGHLHHTPEFLKYNPYLIRGYRINYNTFGKAFKSLFMLHNESVNIWTHFFGGVVFIVICLFLCLSVNSFDSHSLQVFVKDEVNLLFNPIYQSMPNLTQLEHDIEDRILHTRDDIIYYGNHTWTNFEFTLHTIHEEIEHVKENLSPEAIGKFLHKMKVNLEEHSDLLNRIENCVGLTEERRWKLKTMVINLNQKLYQLEHRLIDTIDSAAFDWVDIYRYVNSTYNAKLFTTDDGYRKVPISRWPIIVFLITAIFCLMCSAMYHGFYCLSVEHDKLFSRLDYAGISLLITGSCFPPFVYGFYCEPFYSQLYLTLIGVTSVICFVVSLGDKIHSFEYRYHKSAMYGGLVFFALMPIVHLVYNNINAEKGSDALDFMPSLPYYTGMIMFYLIGLIIYATKYPEKCCPGKFDLIGHSHQLWHCCVLLGIVFTYFGAFNNYYTRIKIPCIGCEL